MPLNRAQRIKRHIKNEIFKGNANVEINEEENTLNFLGGPKQIECINLNIPDEVIFDTAEKYIGVLNVRRKKRTTLEGVY